MFFLFERIFNHWFQRKTNRNKWQKMLIMTFRIKLGFWNSQDTKKHTFAPFWQKFSSKAPKMTKLWPIVCFLTLSDRPLLPNFIIWVKFYQIFKILLNFQNFLKFSTYGEILHIFKIVPNYQIFKVLPIFQNFMKFSKFYKILKIFLNFQNFTKFSKLANILQILLLTSEFY